MKMWALLMLLLAGLCMAMPGALNAADADCLKNLDDTANSARRRVNLYSGEMKTMSDNVWAAKSASICNGALSRADQYFKKHMADDDVCTDRSSYVDSQVAQLYKNARSTCHSEFDKLIRTLPTEEQRLMSDRVAKKEAGLH